MEDRPLSETNENLSAAQTNGKDSENQPSAPQDLTKIIEDLQAQLKEKENKYVYLYADFENFRKRTAKERLDLIKFGWEPVAFELLQVVDNLERALFHASKNTDLVAGLQMVLQQMKSTLEKQGVLPLSSLNQMFDPNLHESVGEETSPHPPGTIMQELARGYTLHGRLLRPARVTISSGPSSEKKLNELVDEA